MTTSNDDSEATYTARLSREIDAAYAAYKAGEPNSEEKLHAALQAQARNVLRHRLVSYEPTLEQEVTHRAMMALRRFRGESELSTWFYRLAQNEADRALRKLIVDRKRLVSMNEPDEGEERPLSELPAKPIDLDAPLDLAKLESVLSPEQAEVFGLAEEGYTLEQIAKKTGTPLGTVRSRYERAKKKMQRRGI